MKTPKKQNKLPLLERLIAFPENICIWTLLTAIAVYEMINPDPRIQMDPVIEQIAGMVKFYCALNDCTPQDKRAWVPHLLDNGEIVYKRTYESGNKNLELQVMTPTFDQDGFMIKHGCLTYSSDVDKSLVLCITLDLDERNTNNCRAQYDLKLGDSEVFTWYGEAHEGHNALRTFEVTMRGHTLY